GSPDLFLAGADGFLPVSHLYRNDHGIFREVPISIPGLSVGAAEFGDFDNDGLLDLLVTGATADGRITRIYRNEGEGRFTDVQAGLPGLLRSSVAWGDFDND